MRFVVPLLLALAFTNCVSAPRAVAPLPSRTVMLAPMPPAPLPMPVADWREAPLTPGGWRYNRDERGTVAMFGQTGGDALVVLRCDRQGGRIFLSVAGASPRPLTVGTSSITRALPTGATGGMPPYLAATLAPADPLLDAMAFSRGRFGLSMAGTAPLVLPAHAEVGRVVEDCRP